MYPKNLDFTFSLNDYLQAFSEISVALFYLL